MRNKALDQLRLIAAFLVVVIHAPLPGSVGAVIEAMTRIAVPVFFMISGYYALGKSKEQLLKSVKKTAFLLLWSVVLYFIWELLWSFYHKNTYEMLCGIFSLKTLLETVLLNNGSLLGHLWFLLALLCCYLLYAFALQKLTLGKRFCLALSLLIGCFVIREILKANGISDPFYYLRNFLFIGVPFFLLGGIVNQKKAGLLSVKAGVWIIAAIAGMLAAIAERLLIGACDLYFGTVIASVALFVLMQNPTVPVCAVLARMGSKHAGNIYIFHVMVIGVFNMAASVAGVLYNNMFLIIRPMLVLAACIIVSLCKNMLRKKRNASMAACITTGES